MEESSYIKKEQFELTFEDFYHGQSFKCNLEGKPCNGKISIENDNVYLCQNVSNGSPCKDKHGFEFSYIILHKKKWVKDGESMFSMKVENLKIEKAIKNDEPLFSTTKNHLPIALMDCDLNNPKDLIVSGLSDEGEDWLLSNFTDGLSFVHMDNLTRNMTFRFRENVPEEEKDVIIKQIKDKGATIKSTYESTLDLFKVYQKMARSTGIPYITIQKRKP